MTKEGIKTAINRAVNNNDWDKVNSLMEIYRGKDYAGSGYTKQDILEGYRLDLEGHTIKGL